MTSVPAQPLRAGLDSIDDEALQSGPDIRLSLFLKMLA